MSVESTDAVATSRGAVRVPLSVLDLVPIADGDTAGEALRNSIDLARRTEAFGYARYWLAEHHLNPGVAGSAPHTLLGIIAGATERIRVGTAATILGNYEPLQVAESFGTVASLWPDRVDLGLGRSGFPPPAAAGEAASPPAAPTAEPVAAASGALPNRIVDGLVVPPARPFHVDRARFALQGRLLGREPGDAARFSDTVDDLLAFFGGGYEGDGIPITVQPAEGSGVQIWIHGSTAGESARIAGRLGLHYGANYHVAPSGVIESLAEYRAHFQPSAELDRPHTIVSVDVVVAETDAEARRLAAGYTEWVLSIREGQGAVPYPRPEDALPDSALASFELAAVQDRLDTRFVGSPETVVGLLETLQRVTGADELLVTTITHDHARRVESYRLLAEAWSGAGPADPADATDLADSGDSADVDAATERAALTGA
ncbi:LLM class flavin-dependent oxidoreductase [Agromyces cerinus]|uniref:Luciferase family oxidoreductase, group 1 n=1 Tax=Agromyces cerinus subsp. cerinus TaxID=232089 RepID=A0A1N6HKU5_9MICO|nr:LLM class flavin-dependent oxidoreductase [Agromyces cerinus]SIO20373.1 luciferase family oxidoreductase, group 1 [Agromyces cerinus subsp. cerinus]